MKVLMINEGALSDYEVFELMKERKDGRLHKSANVAYAERNWMDHKVLKFLSQTHSKCAQLDAERIKQFLREVEKAAIPLTPAEKLQFINHVPVELVDVHLIIEDCAGRFSEVQIEELIQIVEQTLAIKQEDENTTDESAEQDE